MTLNSRIAIGSVRHCRYRPVVHAFQYPLMMMWLDLDELPEVSKRLWGFGTRFWRPLRLRREDHLKQCPERFLKQAAIAKAQALSECDLSVEKVYFLGQLRCFGGYFSPLNLYFLENKSGEWLGTLAEVSNTPWNQRHCYWVPVKMGHQMEKRFHVSPFHPMSQEYRWFLSRTSDTCRLTLQNWQPEELDPIFEAHFDLQFQPITNRTWWRWAWPFPFLSLAILLKIYWQAWKLWWKKVPFHPHPRGQNKEGSHE